MPDRVIRDELLDSERWLAVDNLCRLAFLACTLKCDTAGNLDAQPLRLLRLWRDFGTKTVAASEAVLTRLEAVDLVRLYVFNGRRYVHVPRFGQSRKYLGRLHPESPWDYEKRETQRNKIQTLGEKTTGVLTELSTSSTGELGEDSTGVGLERLGKERKGVAVQNPDTPATADATIKTGLDNSKTSQGNGKTPVEVVAELAAKLTKPAPGERPLTQAEQLAWVQRQVAAKGKH